MGIASCIWLTWSFSQLGLKPPPGKVAVFNSLECNDYIYCILKCMVVVVSGQNVWNQPNEASIVAHNVQVSAGTKCALEMIVNFEFYHRPWKAKHLTCWLMFFWTHIVMSQFWRKPFKISNKTSKQSHSHIFFSATFFESKSAATCWNNTKLEGRVLQYGHGGHSHGRCVADDLGVVSTWWNRGRSD